MHEVRVSSRRKRAWIGHVLGKNCLLKTVTERR